MLFGALLLGGCAVDPNTGEFTGLWKLERVFGPSEAQSPSETVEVHDPSIDEEKFQERKPDSGIFSYPVIGPILTALFPRGNNLPRDEELAIEDRGIALASRPPERLSDGYVTEDREPPILHVYRMKKGRLQTSNAYVLIRGFARDASGVAEIRLNGRPVKQSAQNFSSQMFASRAGTTAVIEAIDNFGNRSELKFQIVRKFDYRRPAPIIIDNSDEEILEARLQDSPAEFSGPGIYMVLMDGTTTRHIIKMPTLEKCRTATEFSSHAACTFHAGG